MQDYRFHHVHLNSPDPLKTAEFYEKMFSAEREEVKKYPDGDVMVHLNLHGSAIWVSGSRAKTPVYGLNHFGFITDNIEAAVAELKANGVEFRLEIKEIEPGNKAAVFMGPENVIIELMEIE